MTCEKVEEQTHVLPQQPQRAGMDNEHSTAFVHEKQNNNDKENGKDVEATKIHM
jgi:hypothetical protein